MLNQSHPGSKRRLHWNNMSEVRPIWPNSHITLRRNKLCVFHWSFSSCSNWHLDRPNLYGNLWGNGWETSFPRSAQWNSSRTEALSHSTYKPCPGSSLLKAQMSACCWEELLLFPGNCDLCLKSDRKTRAKETNKKALGHRNAFLPVEWFYRRQRQCRELPQLLNNFIFLWLLIRRWCVSWILIFFIFSSVTEHQKLLWYAN